ncbi:MAG: hypothetical protein ACKO2L_20900 [Planctomycetaceae bacterium]
MLSGNSRFSWLILCLLLLPLSASAQDTQPSPAPQVPATNPPDKSAADPGQNVLERLIYVPFRELQKVFNNQDASVVIPWSEYLELVQRSFGARPAPAVPQDAVITSTLWTATVEKDVARVALDLRLNLLKSSGWATVPLNFGAAAVGRVEPSDGSVLLKAVAQGQYELLIKAPDSKAVRIELLVPVQTSPEDKSFSIDCPPAGISELTVAIPEADQTVKISPLQVQLPLEQPAAAGQTQVRASLGAVPKFEVRWAPRDGSKPVMDLLASVNSLTTARIETGLVQSRTLFNYEILRGELRELAVIAPRDARIIDVTAAAGRIRAWNATAIGDTHQLIKVELLVPASETFQLEVQTERAFEGDAISLLGRTDDGKLHGVHPEGVVRESGQLTLTTDPTLTAVVVTQSGIRQISTSATAAEKGAAETAESSATVWEYSGVRSRLDVRIRPVEPRLLADHSLQYTFRDDELFLNSEINYVVERAGVFQLVLQIPEGLNIDSVSADGMAEFQLDRGTGKVTLSLTRKRMGPIKVSLQARQPINASVEIPNFTLPIPAPEGVERETGLITLFAPEFLDVVTLDEQLVGLVPARDRIPEPPARLRTVGAWNFTRRPIALSIRSAPRPVQLAASTATTVQVDPELIRQSSIVQFEIRNAGLDTFRIAVPESVAADVRFRTLNPQHVLQQRDRAAEVENGWVTWTLVLQEETTGTLQFAVDWDRPLNSNPAPANPPAAPAAPADAANPASPDSPPALAPATTQPSASTRNFAIEPPRVVPPFPDDQQARRRVILTEARGEIRVLRHPSLSIDAVSSSETAESIDVRELQLMERDGYLAWRYFAQPATASIAVRKHELHEVAATVVSRAAIEVVTEPQALAAWRVRLRMTTSERQRLRIDLPAGSDLQAPLLDDQRTTIEKAADLQAAEGREAYYINISRDGTSDEDFLLTLLYRSPIVEADKRPYAGLGGSQLLRLPVVGGTDEAAVMQQVRVAVWSPEEVAFFGSPERWVQEPRDPDTLRSLLAPPSAARAATQLNDWIGGGISEFATQGQPAVYRSAGNPGELLIHWWKWWFLLPSVSGTLVIAGLILRRTSWENRLTMLLLAAFTAALLSLRQSLGIPELSRTAWPGLLLTAVIWILGLLLGSRSRSTPPPTPAAPPVTPPRPVDVPTAGPDADGGAA